MKSHPKIGIVGIILVIIIFIFATVVIVLIIDLITTPILVELMLEQIMRNWCGIFTRCASQSQPSFFEYIMSGAVWAHISAGDEIIRVKKAAFVGLVAGVGYVASASYYGRRR